MISKSLVSAVSKIALVNAPSDMTSLDHIDHDVIARFISAAHQFNIEAVFFNHSEAIKDFHPDFVISFSHFEPKLTPYPTYYVFPAAIHPHLSSMYFLRNLLSYDGYILQNLSDEIVIDALYKQTNKLPQATLAPLTQLNTRFKALKFKKAKAAYMDINWHGTNHATVFEHPSLSHYVKTFGPAQCWQGYPANLYAGPLPKTSQAIIKTYAQYGLGLYANFSQLTHRGIALNRLAEIMAANAIAMCNYDHDFQMYGDTVIYLDLDQDAKLFAENIEGHIQTVRAKPKQAVEMARAAHDIFIQQFSLETSIEKIIAMHQQVLNKQGYVQAPTRLSGFKLKPEKVTYIVNVTNVNTIRHTVDHLLQQAYQNFHILLLVDDKDIENAYLQTEKPGNVFIQAYTNEESNQAILNFLNFSQSQWLAIIQQDDKLFTHHTAMLLHAYQHSEHPRHQEAMIALYANNLEHSLTTNLSDKLQDPNSIEIKRQSRIANVYAATEIPLCATLFKLTAAMHTQLHSLDFKQAINIAITPSLQPLNYLIHLKTITCSSIINQKSFTLTLQAANHAPAAAQHVQEYS